MASVPPGWYPDPWSLGALRWWDGAQWTGFVLFPGWVSTPQGGLSVAEVASARRSEERLCRWARAAVCCYGIVLLGYMSIFVALSGRLRREMHQFLHDLQIATPNRPPKLDLSGFSAAYAVLTIGELALVAVGVVFLVWQYHAARVARGVGYPARTSPAFGVGSWFIPVVNLWFPYWALADCLPPEHRLRPSVLSAWLAYIGAGFLSSVSSLTALFSAVAAVIILVLALASLAFAVTLGCRLITAVNDDHRQATQAWFS